MCVCMCVRARLLPLLHIYRPDVIVTGCYDGCVRMVNSKGAITAELKAHKKPIHALAAFKSGRPPFFRSSNMCMLCLVFLLTFSLNPTSSSFFVTLTLYPHNTLSTHSSHPLSPTSFPTPPLPFPFPFFYGIQTIRVNLFQ